VIAALPLEINSICARLAEVLAGSAWKGLVLVTCVALLLRCMPQFGAAVRSVVWTAVLLLVLLLPFACFPVVTRAAGSDGVVHASVGWSVAIVAVWGLFSLLRMLQLAGSALRLRAIARRATEVEASGPIAALLAKSPRRVTLAVSCDVSRPSVAGFFRPRILLPPGLLQELSHDELQHVVLHELEHLRRRDDWTNLLQKVGLALFPLHPALLWLDYRLCRERELACDDGVLRTTHARKAYAACLARLAEDSMMRRGLTLALGLLGVSKRRSDLSQRVHRILRTPTESMGRTQMRLATAAVLAGLAGGTLLLARSPRLISFGSVSEPAMTAALTQPAMAAVPAPVQAAHMVATRVVVPRSAVTPRHVEPHLVKVFAARRSRASLREVALVAPTPAPDPYFVLTAWHEQPMEVPRLTLAIAAEDRLPQVSQTAYAAVPVRGGWLLIQL
jgi:beta-lactamase regulating signal transducer with metallopeptidase domain